LVKKKCNTSLQGSFEKSNNTNGKIIKMQPIENITRYTDNLVDAAGYNLYALNREMGYDTEIIIDVDRKVITVDGKNRPVRKIISIPEEVVDKITTEEKKLFIDLEIKEKEVEISNDDEQENRDDSLNKEDPGSDYISEDDMESVVSEQRDSSE
jgi:hypothetical protein